MTSDPQPNHDDERYWAASREAMRRRVRAERDLVIGGLFLVIGVVGSVLVFVVPADHQSGPAGIGPPLTLIVPASIVIAGLMIVARGVRSQRSDHVE
jgi:hypothetical protein